MRKISVPDDAVVIVLTPTQATVFKNWFVEFLSTLPSSIASKIL